MKVEVQAICNYEDLMIKRLVKKGEILIVDQARGKELEKANVCIITKTIEEATIKVRTERATQRKSKKNDTEG